MIYIDENGNPIQETDELQEAIDNITDKLAKMTKEERLAWFEQSIYPEPLKFTNEIDGTVYIVREMCIRDSHNIHIKIKPDIAFHIAGYHISLYTTDKFVLKCKIVSNFVLYQPNQFYHLIF